MNKKTRFWLGIILFTLMFIVGLFVLLKENKHEDKLQLAAADSESGAELSNIRTADAADTKTVDPENQSAGSDTGQEKQAASQISREKFPVYITGAIKKPGIYEIEPGTYLYELIELAGGMTAEACSEHINLAQKIEAESHIVIYRKADYERELSRQQNSSNDFSVQDLDVFKGAAKTDSESTSAAGTTALVNINLAGMEELVKLPGVGESTARKIIAYRENNGAFKNIEEIMLVPGIKENKFNQFKDKICV